MRHDLGKIVISTSITLKVLMKRTELPLILVISYYKKTLQSLLLIFRVKNSTNTIVQIPLIPQW